jgi:ureidoacrylate peracid hydrolase
LASTNYSFSTGKAVSFDARPAPVTLDAAQTAVLVIDMQNDFGSPGGMFDRAGIPIAGIQAATKQTARFLQSARARGLKIIYIKMGFHSDLSNLGPVDAPNRTRHARLGVGDQASLPDGKSWRILVRDGWGTDVVNELAPLPGDTSIWKHRFSSFFETELDATLKAAGIKHLIITGCTTSICVESTVRDAFFRDYHCVLLSDCMAEPIGQDAPRSNHDATLLSMEVLFAWVASSGDVTRALEGSPR